MKITFSKVLGILWIITWLYAVSINAANYNVCSWIVITIVLLLPFFIAWCVTNKQKVINTYAKIAARISAILWILFWIGFAIYISQTGTWNMNDSFVLILLLSMPFLIAWFVKRKKKETSEQTINEAGAIIESQNITYIETGKTIIRTDNKPISDEEVPYLIQVGYENALRKMQESPNPKFHRTFKESDLSFNFSMKYSSEISKREDKFETLYRTASQTDDLSKRIELLNQAVVAFEKARNFCYSKGKGGTIYFQDMWEHMHNSQNPCFSYLDTIRDSLNEALSERDEIIPSIIEIITMNGGILQKDIYNELPNLKKSDIQQIIKKLETEGKLQRLKKSGSYELHVTE